MAPGRQASAGLRKYLGKVLEAYLLFPFFAMLMLVVIWSGTHYLIKVERTATERAAAESVSELAETYEAQMIRNLDAIDHSLKTLKYAYEIRGEKPSLSYLQDRGLLPHPLIFTVAIADRNGDVVASTRPSGNANVADGHCFRQHQALDTNQPLVIPVFSAEEDGKLQFSRRINSSEGDFAGMVMVLVEPHYFTSGYDRSRLGEHGVLGLIGENGTFLVKRSGDDVSSGDMSGKVDAEQGATVLSRNEWDGVRRYTQTRRLYSFPLTLVVGLSRAEQMEAFERRKANYFWGASAVTVALVLVAGLLSLFSWKLDRSQRRTRKEQETYFAASEASLDAVFVYRSLFDQRGRIVDFVLDTVNARGAELLGRERSELLGRRLRDLLPRRIAVLMIREFTEVAASGATREREWENTMPGIRANWLYRQVVRVADGVVVILRDISERKLIEERISHMAHHDALTGLPNRTLLEDRLRQAISQAQRSGRSLTVVFIDLDNFKMVNDTLGHKVGDELLKVIAQRMVQCVRQSDTVVRLGGDEFVIVVNDLPETPQSLAPSLQRIRDALAEPVELAGQSLEVTASIGLAIYPKDGSDGETLLMNADAAMYQAKAQGRNSYYFFTAEINRKIHERLALQDGLRNALAREEFFLVYQPQIDLRTGGIIGVEVLIRWQHPEMGQIAPMEFVSLAEENGMIVPIGEWVLRTACRQGKAWQDAGLPPMIMSVNVSARQFRDNNLIDQVRAALDHSGLDARYLELELTESLIMQNTQQAVSIMRALRSLGVRLSIDDFGSGYSSLSALKSFPIARLKLDRMFVRDLPGDEGDRAIALTVISMGHTLNLRVLAEGVETTGQLAFLRNHGCDEGQGYFFCAPLVAEEIEAYCYERQSNGLQMAFPDQPNA